MKCPGCDKDTDGGMYCDPCATRILTALGALGMSPEKDKLKSMTLREFLDDKGWEIISGDAPVMELTSKEMDEVEGFMMGRLMRILEADK